MSKRKFLCILLSIVSLTSNAQDLYDLTTIQTIKITFAESNWDQLLDAEKAGNEDYIMATEVTINGVSYDSVGVKYKGNSTYNSNQIKNPFHIELDTYKSQDYQGYKDIKLSNVAKDPSFLREVLSYAIIRQYMNAPKSNYANVYVNGTLIGLYSNSEAVSKAFLKSEFDSKNNTFVKCNPPAGAGPQTNDFPNLVYAGTDSANYDAAYEIKSDDGWQDLLDLCDSLGNNLNAIESILDVDRTIWMLALDNVMVNLDSYIGAFAQNYYLYQNDFDQFIPIIWDLNESFGVFSMTGTSSLMNTTAKQQMSHLLHENDANYPLMKQLMNISMYKRMYLAHIKTILNENFESGSYQSMAQTLQSLITSAVQSDNNKFFSNAEFISNLTTDVNSGGPGPGGGSYPGIINLMDARSSYLLGLSDFNSIEPNIINVTPLNSNPLIYDNVSVNTTVTDANEVYIGYRDNIYEPFNRTLMFDDGNHNDGNANDGVFGFDLNMTNVYVQYYIYAENNDIGKFSPARAEYEYHIIETFLPPPGDIVINEFQADNSSTISDQNDEFDDWIELYNNTNTTIDLDGYYLSDDPSNLFQWSFPAGTSILAGGYLVVWSDKDTLQTGLHTNFKLSSSGETIFLSDNTGSLIDQVSFASQSTDFSYARFPNGTGSFQEMYATYNSVNIDLTGTVELDFIDTELKVYPNPAESIITLELTNLTNLNESVIIYNALGQRILELTAVKTIQLNVSSWPKGLYLIKWNENVQQLIVR